MSVVPQYGQNGVVLHKRSELNPVGKKFKIVANVLDGHSWFGVVQNLT